MKEAKEESLRLEDICIVQQYSDVFLDDLSGLPPEREVEFFIELVPSTESISILLYKIAPAKLKELKAQL